MVHFTPVASTLGGLLIGLAASALLLFNGRLAGISSILGQALTPPDGDRLWRPLFLAGLGAGGVGLVALHPGAFDAPAEGSLVPLVVAGLLVGFGTRLGGGCTSGHGICGLARFSARSLVATAVFMAAGVATVFVARHLLGQVGGAP